MRDAITVCRQGLACHAAGKLDQAIAQFSAAIRMDPRYASAYCNRAIAFYQQGQLDKAIADFSRAIELAPASARAYNNRGVTYRKRAISTAPCSITPKPSSWTRTTSTPTATDGRPTCGWATGPRPTRMRQSAKSCKNPRFHESLTRRSYCANLRAVGSCPSASVVLLWLRCCPAAPPALIVLPRVFREARPAALLATRPLSQSQLHRGLLAPGYSASRGFVGAVILHADGNVVTRSVSEGRKAFPRLRFGLQSNVSFVSTRTIAPGYRLNRPIRSGGVNCKISFACEELIEFSRPSHQALMRAWIMTDVVSLAPRRLGGPAE